MAQQLVSTAPCWVYLPKGGIHLDDASVTAATPEVPAILNMAGALLIPGIGGLLTLRKRRKRA